MVGLMTDAAVEDGSENSAYKLRHDANSDGFLKLLRDATLVGSWSMRLVRGVGSLFLIDVVTSGTYTYKIQARIVSTDNTQVNRVKLFAYEL